MKRTGASWAGAWRRFGLGLAATALVPIGFACTRRNSEVSESTASPQPIAFDQAIHISPRYDAQASAVVVDVGLDKGFHVYTTGESVGRPLHIALLDAGDWRPRAPAEYPSGRSKETALGRSVVVEDRAEVRLEVEPLMDRPGPIQGSFRYQVCTDVACDRPRTLPFELSTHEANRKGSADK